MRDYFLVVSYTGTVYTTPLKLARELIASTALTQVLIEHDTVNRAMRVYSDVVIPTDVEDAVVAHLVAARTRVLEAAISAKIAAIDTKTARLLGAGFTFDDGQEVAQYSLSLNAQSRLEGTWQLQNEPEFTWPLAWSSKDSSYITTLTQSQFRSFYLTAAGVVLYYIQSGYPLRTAAIQAVTLDEVAAVVDTRT